MDETLDRETRLLLLRFACAMAWTDFELHPKERALIEGMVDRLELAEADRKKVKTWLREPPAPEDVDPQQIPLSKRSLFLAECESVVKADGVIRAEETEALDLLRAILRAEADAD